MGRVPTVFRGQQAGSSVGFEGPWRQSSVFLEYLGVPRKAYSFHISPREKEIGLDEKTFDAT